MNSTLFGYSPKDKDSDESENQRKIIIKKENIGLEEYQHQKFQFSLFNSLLQHDQYNEDVSRFKDRFERAAPNMQQVIHTDMKRANTNKIYERQLKHTLNGPRGLDWQCRQELQRLQNNERDIERDLIRLNRGLARKNQPPRIVQSPVSHHNTETSRLKTKSPLPSSHKSDSPIQGSPNQKDTIGRSISLYTTRPSVSRPTEVSKKRFSLNQPRILNEIHVSPDKQTATKSNKERLHLQQHAQMIELEKQKLEEKLREFLL